MKAAILCIGVLLSVGACKKGSGGGGGGGGGGGWLVGSDGMMLNVKASGLTSGYDIGSHETLNGIACSDGGEAWVAGTHGTLLYTADSGTTWLPRQVPTSADLRALATQDLGRVFVVGNGVFMTSFDIGASWTLVGDGKVNFRAVAAAQEFETVLAVGDDGSLWSYERGALVHRGTFPGARAVAISPDGQTAVLVGDNLIAKSVDGGRVWAPLASPEHVRYDDVRLDDRGQAVAVGSGGALAHIADTGAVVIQRLGSADLHTIHLAQPDDDTENLGLAGGDGGTVWLTSDGGTTWKLGPNAGQTVLGVDQIGAWHR